MEGKERRGGEKEGYSGDQHHSVRARGKREENTFGCGKERERKAKKTQETFHFLHWAGFAKTKEEMLLCSAVRFLSLLSSFSSHGSGVCFPPLTDLAQFHLSFTSGVVPRVSLPLPRQMFSTSLLRSLEQFKYNIKHMAAFIEGKLV